MSDKMHWKEQITIENAKIKIPRKSVASNGQQFPCPAQHVFALSFSFIFMEGSRAVAQIGDEVL